MPTDDGDDFRLRPKPPRASKVGESAAWSIALRTVLRYARATSANARGASRPGKPRAFRSQRCAVRVMYSQNKVAGQWRAHGRYIARDSAAGQGFGACLETVSPAEELARWQKAGDLRLWKLILSPEFGERLDLNALTQDVMKRMEMDLGTRLEWVAVAHFNTEHPHVHVALRGVREDGSPLELPREYVRHGIRRAAEQFCTAQLGFRTELDAREAERREVAATRYTSLDRIIGRANAIDQVDAAGDRFLFRERVGETGDSDSNLRNRLLTLRAMSLAEEAAPGEWRVRRDFESVLRAMQRVADRQKMLVANGALLSDRRLNIEALDQRTLKAVEGRILTHGEDEATGRSYLLMEGTDAKVHLVYHTPEVTEARGRGLLKPNAFVRLQKLFDGGRPVLEVEDLGDAERLLNNHSHMERTARALVRRGIVPTEDGWGGWLGRYQAALTAAAVAARGREPRPKHSIDR